MFASGVVRRSRVASALAVGLAGLILLLSQVAFAGRVAAAEIPGAITSITTTATTVGQWDEIDFACTWAVPNGSKAGDTFTMQLPPELQWWGAAAFKLTDPAGNVVATAVASADGSVVFTLTSFVTTHPSDVHGTCNFTTQYTVTQTQPGPQTLTFTVGAQVINIPITQAGPCTSDCPTAITSPDKRMWWTGPAQDALQSVILLPALTAASSDVTITDTPGPGISLDCATVKPLVGRTVDASGYVVAPDDSAAYPASVNCSPGQLTAAWTNVPAGEYVQVWVQAVVTDSTLASYSNAGVVVVNGQQAPVSTQVSRTDASGTGEGTGLTPSPSPTTAAPSPTATPSSTPTAASPTRTATTSTTVATSAAGSATASPSGAVDAISVTRTGLATTGADTRSTALVGAVLVLGGAAMLGLGALRRSRP